MDEVRKGFDGTSASVLRLLRSRRPERLYPLKSLLSQFMLLPALYVHLRDGHGIWKADSFESCRTDFEPQAWAAMDDVSALRRAWHQPSQPALRPLLTSPTTAGHLARKRYGPRIPGDLAARLDDDLHTRMERLTEQMRTRAREFEPPSRVATP
jgi:hypothetical protein